MTEINTNVYENAVNKHACPQMLHYSLYMKSNQVCTLQSIHYSLYTTVCSLSQFLEQAITPINSASLIAKRVYSKFTH